MCSLGVDDVICSTSSTKYEGVKKIEVVTVFELNAYVVNSTPHVKSLTVSSSICLITNVPHFLASQVTEFCAPEKGELIETGSGWCYISCSNGISSCM